ncbi:right-handed parallel beta-helix repeat-containing protein [Blastopirellula sp. J2-11]|uniref:right-handed parallel beta-helix repeat-containing protein n=1 Tax=Blastopirellula sp. J2-11 TaxID=2943192 RepID=UPI0021C57EE0|nr:right-handed parallel beta-helix repeat-containing protein [Blastopirellula sp. J2-11]UUO07737.1 right-handed parallel beta-helix repeat-containing protein [Blastopirellula sp. J2-11]
MIDHQNTIIDFNGAHLKLKPNGLKKYSIVEIIDGAKNLRITNGTIQGDKEDHDFKTNRGSHEWGHGLVVHGGSELEIDHLTVSGVTGDGVSTRFTGARNREELVSKILHSVYPRDLESGGFSAAGGKIDNGETIRSIAPFDLAKSEGEFEFGYSTGYSGYPFIQDREYRAFFFDESQQFLESQRCLQFRKVQVPPAARFVHLEFNQSNVPDRPLHAGAGRKSFAGRISDYKGSVDVHFHHNKLVANRRLGMGYCGGRRWLIEENHFVQNGGVAPGYGIDLEDGWESMQDVVIRNNYFKENQRGDLVICAGTELLIEGNHFEGNVAVHGRPHNYTFRKNHFTGGHIGYTTRTGVAEIHDNYYENCTLSIRFDTAAVADGLRRDPGESVRTPPLKLRNETLRSVKKLTGTYVDFANSSFEDVKFVAGKETQLMLFKGGVVESCSALFEATGPPVLFQADFCQGELVEEGPGRSRLKPQNGNSK